MTYFSYNKEYFLVCIDLFKTMFYTEPITQKGKDDVFPVMTKLLKKSHDF